MTRHEPDSTDPDVLVARLAASDLDTTLTRFEITLGAGSYYSRYSHRATESTHRLDVQLHPYGLGNTGYHHGVAVCSCVYWSDHGWLTGQTPRMLPYVDLAAWIAEHAADVGATQVAELMRGVPLLRALNA